MQAPNTVEGGRSSATVAGSLAGTAGPCARATCLLLGLVPMVGSAVCEDRELYSGPCLPGATATLLGLEHIKCEALRQTAAGASTPKRCRTPSTRHSNDRMFSKSCVISGFMAFSNRGVVPSSSPPFLFVRGVYSAWHWEWWRELWRRLRCEI